MIANRAGNLFSFSGILLLLFSFNANLALAQSSSSSQVWKSCQSSNADERLTGCTTIIKSNGSGSLSRLSDALDARCWAYHMKGEFVLAVEDCKASIKIRPNYSYAYNNLGTAYLGMGEFADAIIVLNKAIELKPNYFWSRLNRAKAYAAIGKKQEAVRDYQFALALAPENGEAKEALRTLTASDAGDANSQVANNPTVVKQPEASLLLQQQIPGAVTPPVSSGKVSIFGRRIALIIGNGNYKNVPVLSNPQRDAMLVADALKRTGFQTVTMQTDLGRDALILALRNFAQEAESADWSVVYYSGHGMEVGGVNYLIPIDAKLATDRDISVDTVATSARNAPRAAPVNQYVKAGMVDAPPAQSFPFAFSLNWIMS